MNRPGVLPVLFLALGLFALVNWLGYCNFSQSPPAHQQSISRDLPTSINPMPTPNPVVSVPPTLPFEVQVVYSPQYLINLAGLERLHPFDIKKYQKIHQQLLAEILLTESQTLRPESLTADDLKLIHSDEYLQSLQDRQKLIRYLEAPALQYVPLSLDSAVLEPFRCASGGTLLAARSALNCGIGINLGGGYHHAKPDRGEGFCVYADVPIAIRKLQAEGLIKTALIVDVDVHQGNGTILCLADDEMTFTFSMHQRDIFPVPKEIGDLDIELDAGMGDEEYLEILAENLPDLFQRAQPDICFIIGGCDPLSGDPLAALEMTPAGIVTRDEMIVNACAERQVPVVLTLSGGYSPAAWRTQFSSVKNLIEKFGIADPTVSD